MLCFVRKRDPRRFDFFLVRREPKPPHAVGAAFSAFCRLVTRAIKAQRPALDSPQGPASNRSFCGVSQAPQQREQPAFTNEFGQGATRWWDFETFWRTPVTLQATSLLSDELCGI